MSVTLAQQWLSVSCLLEKIPVSTCEYGVGVSCFELPVVTQQFVFYPDAQLIALVELFTHRCTCYDWV